MDIDVRKFMRLQGTMTHEQFAEKIGVTSQTIINIYSRERCGRITFVKILNAFNIEAEELLKSETNT